RARAASATRSASLPTRDTARAPRVRGRTSSPSSAPPWAASRGRSSLGGGGGLHELEHEPVARTAALARDTRRRTPVARVAGIAPEVGLLCELDARRLPLASPH